MAEHKDIQQDGVHIPHFRKVATYTDLSSEVIDAFDLGKIALVEDTGAYYRLDVVNPISWVKVADTPTELAQYLATKVNISDVKDNLISEDINKPLSANQGKILQDTKVDKVTGSNLVQDTKVSSYDSHIENTSNPHGVTASQVGAYTTAQTDTAISTAISSLVDSSPETLDTLKELSSALGDDPNFATTVSTALGNRVSKVTSTDDAIVRFNGVTGEVQNSLATIDDLGNITINGGAIDARSDISASINQWKYLRLSTDSTIQWDIATRDNDVSGALQFRQAGTLSRLNIMKTGEVRKPYQPIISGQIGSAVTNPVAPLVLPFNEFWVNQGGIAYNTTTKRFTVPVAGVYRITFNPFFNNGQVASRVCIGINTDAPTATTHRGHSYRESATYDTGCLNSIVSLNANDYIVFYLYSGGLYNQSSDKFNQFTIELIA